HPRSDPRDPRLAGATSHGEPDSPAAPLGLCFLGRAASRTLLDRPQMERSVLAASLPRVPIYNPRQMLRRLAILPLLIVSLARGQDEAAAPSSPTDDGVRVTVLGYHDFSETENETEMRIRTS